MNKQDNCDFCQIIYEEKKRVDVVEETEQFIAFYDEYPVNEGHTLVIPKEHVKNIEEYDYNMDIFQFLLDVHKIVKEKHKVDDTNIGINNGSVAGQTIPHLHWHIIPRYEGDVDDPTGGVRGVLPSEQKY